MTQPDSPEDILEKVYRRGFGHAERQIMNDSLSVDQALTKLDEYYTNKFLEAELRGKLEMAEILKKRSKAVDLLIPFDDSSVKQYFAELDDGITVLKQAIKNLNKAQLASEEE